MNGLKEEVAEGKYILSFPHLASTQDYARKIISACEKDIVGVRADYQSSGRGRLQSRWIAAPNSSLLVSYIFDLDGFPERHVKLISLVAAVSVITAISESTNLIPKYKWPNDILISNRKVCGVLIETPAFNRSMRQAIIGVGINLTQKAFPPEIESIATSIAMEGGQAPTSQALAKTLYHKLLWWSDILRREGVDPITKILREHDGYTGDHYRAITDEGEREGTAVGVTSNGELILKMEDGSLLATQNATSLKSVHRNKIPAGS